MRTTTIVGITVLTTAALAAPAAVVAHDNLGDLLPVTRIAGSSGMSFLPDSSSAGNGWNGDDGASGTSASSTSGTSTIATEAQQRGVVMIDSVTTNGEGAGSGMVLRSDGTVLTNYHVVEGSTQIRVTVPGGQKYTAEVVGHDESHDIAVLKLKGASNLATVRLDTDGVKVSEKVLAVGQGGGEGVLYAASGLVTATDRSITASDSTALDSSEELTGLIQTSAPIVGGYSGGPLFDADGEVIGIDTAAASSNSLTAYGNGSSRSAEGYAIPITQAKSLADTILAGTKTSTNHIGHRAALGIAVVPSGSSRRGMTPYGGSSGVTVQNVQSGSATASTGLAAGDVITALDGTTISDTGDLADVMDGHYPGDSMKVTWTDTSGVTRTATVTLQKATTN